MLSADPATRQRDLLIAALLISAVIHAGLWRWVRGSEPSLEDGSAPVTARVDAELRDQEIVELENVSPREAPFLQSPPSKPDRKTPRPTRSAPAASRRPLVTGAPPSPAAPRRAPPHEPIASPPEDLGAETVAAGRAAKSAGRTTAATGVHQVVVSMPDAERGRRSTTNSVANPVALERSSAATPVGLDEHEWHCVWPREAEADHIDEPSVVLRVMVRADGSAESARLIADPGHGFGAAALRCALETRFVAARDRYGNAIRAESAPIRVRFTR